MRFRLVSRSGSPSLSWLTPASRSYACLHVRTRGRACVRPRVRVMGVNRQPHEGGVAWNRMATFSCSLSLKPWTVVPECARLECARNLHYTHTHTRARARTAAAAAANRTRRGKEKDTKRPPEPDCACEIPYASAAKTHGKAKKSTPNDRPPRSGFVKCCTTCTCALVPSAHHRICHRNATLVAWSPI